MALSNEDIFSCFSVMNVWFTAGSVVASGQVTAAGFDNATSLEQRINQAIANSSNPIFRNNNVTSARVTGQQLAATTLWLYLAFLCQSVFELIPFTIMGL